MLPLPETFATKIILVLVWDGNLNIHLPLAPWEGISHPILLLHEKETQKYYII